MTNNSLATPGYFLKRMRDAGFIAIRLFQDYSPEDPRKWTVMINPSKESIMITCLNLISDQGNESTKFSLHDGGIKWPTNFIVSTSSINVIIQELLNHEVECNNENSKYYRQRISNS